MSQNPALNIMPVSRVIELYQSGMEKYGGDSAYFNTNLDCIGGVLGSALQNTYYTDQAKQNPNTDEPNIIYFASYALLLTVIKHCFTDGNKRLGWQILVDLLATKHLTLNATDDEAVNFVLGIAINKISDIEDIVDWVSSRLVSI